MFMGPTWGPSGADRTQVGPMLAPWTLLSGTWTGRCQPVLVGPVNVSHEITLIHTQYGTSTGPAQAQYWPNPGLMWYVCEESYIRLTSRKHHDFSNHWQFEGILPKGPYLPCVSMAGRALLAGYHRFIRLFVWQQQRKHWRSALLKLCEGNTLVNVG